MSLVITTIDVLIEDQKDAKIEHNFFMEHGVCR